MRLIKSREYIESTFFRLARLLATSKWEKRNECDNRKLLFVFLTSRAEPQLAHLLRDRVQLAHALIKSHEPNAIRSTLLFPFN